MDQKTVQRGAEVEQVYLVRCSIRAKLPAPKVPNTSEATEGMQ